MPAPLPAAPAAAARSRRRRAARPTPAPRRRRRRAPARPPTAPRTPVARRRRGRHCGQRDEDFVVVGHWCILTHRDGSDSASGAPATGRPCLIVHSLEDLLAHDASPNTARKRAKPSRMRLGCAQRHTLAGRHLDMGQSAVVRQLQRLALHVGQQRQRGRRPVARFAVDRNPPGRRSGTVAPSAHAPDGHGGPARSARGRRRDGGRSWPPRSARCRARGRSARSRATC